MREKGGDRRQFGGDNVRRKTIGLKVEEAEM